jgi:glycosyltransferase involved in cell wall biosynthesis
LVIAINTRLLLKNKLEGIGNFTFEIVKRLAINHPEHQFLFIFDRPYDQEFVVSSNVTPIVLFPPARHPILYKIWFDFRIPMVLKKYKADIFFSPDGFLSQYTKIPQVPVIHDLNFEHNPEDLRKRDTKYYLKYFPRFAKIAKKIITVSEFSKNDIANIYSIENELITVVHNGVKDGFKPLQLEEQKCVREEFSHSLPYFLYVGALHKRKNISNLLKSFDSFKEQVKSNHLLLIAGAEMFKDEEMNATYQKMTHKQDVKFLGRISHNDLCKLMASASALMYVSLFEGFGIPIIEAMQSGTPVITSNTSSMPEIAGEAALLVEPNDVGQIAEAMGQILDEKRRNELIQLGHMQCRKFNWDESAQSVMDVLNSVLD